MMTIYGIIVYIIDNMIIYIIVNIENIENIIFEYITYE
jgi:hypothetical protein